MVKGKLLISHITVQSRNMTNNTACMTMATMRAVTVIIMRIHRKRIAAIQDVHILVSMRVFTTSGIDSTFDTHKEQREDK